MSIPFQLRWALPAIAPFLLLLLGCSEPAGLISGKVTYKGAVVSAGSVSFQMKEKGIAQDAKLDSSGSFAMAAPLPVGTYQICIIPPAPEPRDPTKGAPPAIKTNVPRRYQGIQTSDVKVMVKAGNNEIPIDLKE